MTSSQTRIPTLLRRALPPALLLITLFFLSAPLRALEPHTASPRRLTIAAQRGDVLARPLLLRGAERLSSLHIMTRPLANRDGGPALPAHSLSVQMPLAGPLASSPGADLALDLVVDLTGAPAGAYVGEATVVYAEWQHPVAVEVLVKEPLLLPLLVLCAGMVLGLALSLRRGSHAAPPLSDAPAATDQGVQAARRLVAVREPPAPFRLLHERFLAQASAAAERGDGAQAQVQRRRAEYLLEIWRRTPAEWHQALEKLAMLRGRVEEIADEEAGIGMISPFVADLGVGLEGVLGQTIDDALLRYAAGERKVSFALRLDARLCRAQRALEQYGEGQEQVRCALANAMPESGEPDREEIARLRLLRAELRQLRPWSDTHCASAFATLRTRIGPPALRAASAANSAALLERAADHSEETAAQREAVLAIALFAGMILLASLGFREIYAKNPLFGARGWSDWLALLAWGFGSETSRAALAGWLAGLQSPPQLERALTTTP